MPPASISSSSEDSGTYSHEPAEVPEIGPTDILKEADNLHQNLEVFHEKVIDEKEISEASIEVLARRALPCAE